MDVPDKFYWMGKPEEELTREELLKIIRYLHTMWQNSMKTTQSVIDITRLARQAQRQDWR
jgi:hypothetical protein